MWISDGEINEALNWIFSFVRISISDIEMKTHLMHRWAAISFEKLYSIMMRWPLIPIVSVALIAAIIYSEKEKIETDMSQFSMHHNSVAYFDDQICTDYIKPHSIEILID